jgi:hypothetical protein
MAMKTLVIAAVAALALAPAARAQEPVGSSGPMTGFRSGWTLTPSLGFGETYDDNISLFGVRTAEEVNNDFVQSWFPSADLHYAGKHTELNAGYTGSFIAYRTFSSLNRWGQRAHLDLRRQETARVKWSVVGNVLAVPTTDLVDVGGLPFLRTGVTTSDIRAGVTYILNARDSLSGSGGSQFVDFDRPLTADGIVHGGRVFEGVGGWRHKMNSRLALGTDYSFRRAHVVGTIAPYDLHSVQGGVDYDINSLWVVNGSAGVVFLAANGLTESRLGPAWRLTIERRRTGRTFHATFLQSYVPSFGFGGTIRNQELNVGLRAQLTRRFYTEQSAIYRDDEPLTNAFQQLPLKSLRALSLFGYAPQPWVRFEAFYARTQQTNFGQFGRTGQLYRNRVGFQIVTSKPVRIQ